MTNETPFQEKPDWKGKLSQLSGKLTSIFKKDKSTNIPSLPGATGTFQSSDRSERTLTQFVVNAWKKRVSPKLAGAAAVGVGRFGGGVAHPSG